MSFIISKQEQMQSKKEKILQDCIKQSKKFIKWASQKQWKTFHSSHYDWWAFPIDKPSSSYGKAYQVGKAQLQYLKNNKQFIQTLRTNSILVCRSWGYDLQKGDLIKNPDSDQKWQRWPIRLSKMSRSLEIFQQRALFCHSIQYGCNLLKTFKKFTYSGKDLTGYFHQNMAIIRQNKSLKNSQNSQNNKQGEDKKD